MRSLSTVWITAGLLLCPGGVCAQDVGGEEHQRVQAWDLDNQRRTLLALADSMPDRWLNDADNAGQRSFAQQIAHASVAFAQVVARFFGDEELHYAVPADAEARRYTKAELRATVDGAYDYMSTVLLAQTPTVRRQTMPFAGQTMPVWQVWDELGEHTMWIAGQTVGNFRKHGMAPPPLRYVYPPQAGR